MEDKLIYRIGGRKFILSMATLLVTGGLCAFGYIHEGVYSTVVIAVVGAYIAGNVTQKIQTAEGK